MAPTQSPITPPSWTVPSWYIDPANSTACASDSNSGTSATCGTTGIGPLASWRELYVHRWQCFGGPANCPALPQNTTVQFLSAQSVQADTISASVGLNADNYLLVQCPLQAANVVASGTLNAVTAKNRGSNQALTSSFTLTSGSVAQSDLVVNTTHAARAWIIGSSSPYLLTQPIASPTIPIAQAVFNPTLTEVDTWAHSDAVTVYAPTTIYVGRVSANIAGFDASLSGGLYFQTCNFGIPGGTFEHVNFGPHVVALESSSSSEVIVSQENALLNTYIGSPASGVSMTTLTGAGTTESAAISVYAGGTVGQVSFVASMLMDYDYVLSGGVADNVNGMGYVYADTSNVVNVSEFAAGYIEPEGSGGNILYGPGSLTVYGRLQYHTPASGAGGSLPISGGIQISGSANACSNAAGTIACGISITAAHLDAAAGVSGFGGDAFILGGGSIATF